MRNDQKKDKKSSSMFINVHQWSSMIINDHQCINLQLIWAPCFLCNAPCKTKWSQKTGSWPERIAGTSWKLGITVKKIFPNGLSCVFFCKKDWSSNNFGMSNKRHIYIYIYIYIIYIFKKTAAAATAPNFRRLLASFWKTLVSCLGRKDICEANGRFRWDGHPFCSMYFPIWVPAWDRATWCNL